MYAMTTEDVIADFLEQTYGEDPREYIRQASSRNTSFVPVHFYRVALRMTTAQLIDYVSDINTRSQAKSKLLERLRAGDAMQTTEPSLSKQHPFTVIRKKHFDSLSIGELPLQPFTDAVRALDDSLIVELREQLLAALKHCFETYTMSPPVRLLTPFVVPFAGLTLLCTRLGMSSIKIDAAVFFLCKIGVLILG